MILQRLIPLMRIRVAIPWVMAAENNASGTLKTVAVPVARRGEYATIYCTEL